MSYLSYDTEKDLTNKNYCKNMDLAIMHQKQHKTLKSILTFRCI